MFCVSVKVKQLKPLTHRSVASFALFKLWIIYSAADRSWRFGSPRQRIVVITWGNSRFKLNPRITLGEFLWNGTNVHLASRTNWLGFGGQRSKFKPSVTSCSPHSCECNILETPWGNFTRLAEISSWTPGWTDPDQIWGVGVTVALWWFKPVLWTPLCVFVKVKGQGVSCIKACEHQVSQSHLHGSIRFQQSGSQISPHNYSRNINILFSSFVPHTSQDIKCAELIAGQ